MVSGRRSLVSGLGVILLADSRVSKDNFIVIFSSLSSWRCFSPKSSASPSLSKIDLFQTGGFGLSHRSDP